MPKIPLPPWAIRMAYRLVDVESSGETAVVDNRIHEYAFVLSEIARLPPGKLLDVGCAARVNTVPAFACESGWTVWGLDKRKWRYYNPSFTLLQQDIADPLPDIMFDVVVALSTIEHIGMAGRYGITRQDNDADVAAVSVLREHTVHGGTLLLTVPYTLEQGTITGMSRIYDLDRLTWLLTGWRTQHKELTPDGTTILVKAVKK